jgi:hypothetical protein
VSSQHLSASVSSDSVALDWVKLPRVWVSPVDHSKINIAVEDANNVVPSRPLSFSASPFWANVMTRYFDHVNNLAYST